MDKTKLLTILLVLTIVWATSSTYLYWREKNNPQVIAITTENGRFESPIELKDSEKVAFIRRFIDSYLTYNSDNFRQSQALLTSSMSASLREKRLKEIDRIYGKIEQKNFSQRSTIYSIAQTEPNKYQIEIELQINENTKESTLAYTVPLSLKQTERSIQNPLGIIVEDMDLISPRPQTSPKGLDLSIQTPGAITLSLPCPVENVQNQEKTDLKIRTTTLTNSEVYLSTQTKLSEPAKISIACANVIFEVILRNATSHSDQFVLLPLSLAKEKPKVIVPKKKSFYEKMMEDALNAK